MPRCLKITEKVSFNIASEASYVYILSVQKLIKKSQKWYFGEFFKTLSLRSNSVTRHVTFNRTKIGGNAKIQNFKCDILSDFQTLCCCKGYFQPKALKEMHAKWSLNLLEKQDWHFQFTSATLLEQIEWNYKILKWP